MSADNTDMWVLLFTGVVAISTVLYVALTGWLAWETRNMRKAQTEPQIAAYVHPSERASGFLDLFVQNTGLGAARNVRLSVDPELEYLPGKHLSDLGIFKSGWNYLAPNQRLHICYIRLIPPQSSEGEEAVKAYNKKLGTPITISTKWENATRKVSNGSYTLDFSGTSKMLAVAQPLPQIESHLKSIAEHIGYFADHMKREELKASCPVQLDNDEATDLHIES